MNFAVILIISVLAVGFPASARPVSQKKGAAKDSSSKAKDAKVSASKPKADYGEYAFSFATLDGKNVTLADYAGKTVLVNIWAPWCGPCRMEAPGFAALYKEYHPKGFEIISVAVQTNETDVRSFVAKYPMQWPVGIKDEVAMHYKTYGLPDNYVFRADGSVARHFIGFTSEEALKHVLTELLPK